ncbi:MAG TPA: trypsin-like peptidase domain-containing protein [Methanomassiliicoccales archaeon]|jgi:serine protease Do
MTAEFEERHVQAVEKAGASIVNVRSGTSHGGACCGPFHRMGSGSGLVLDDKGHILTNHHVVCDMDSVTVIMGNGHVFTGKVVGGDQRTDIAVVKIESDELVPAVLADSDDLKLGQPILAMGNSFGLPHGPVVTSGVVSYLPRGLSGHEGMIALWTDATINPGNRGGALVDLDGNVIAVNAVRAPYAEGMGQAIPVNMAKSIAAQIIEHGKVQRAWLGVTAYDVTTALAYQFQLPDTDGAFVAETAPEGPAETAGLHMGDVVLSLDDKHVGNVSDLLTALTGMKSGQEIDVKVRRNGRTEAVRVTLGTRPY